MDIPERRIFSLPEDQAMYIDASIASGRYASADEVVRAALQALQERDMAGFAPAGLADRTADDVVDRLGALHREHGLLSDEFSAL